MPLNSCDRRYEHDCPPPVVPAPAPSDATSPNRLLRNEETDDQSMALAWERKSATSAGEHSRYTVAWDHVPSIIDVAKCRR